MWRVDTPVYEKFSDVEREWYVGMVQYVYDTNTMSGTSTSTFSPNEPLTRAEFVTVLYNNYGKPTVAFDSVFDDVDSGDYFALPVLWAHENNITKGVSADNFGSDTKITREQLALMLYKYAALQGEDQTYDTAILDEFPDKGQVHDWAKEAIKWAVTKGVMSGKGTSTVSYLDPTGEATRAECAAMMMNYAKINW